MNVDRVIFEVFHFKYYFFVLLLGGWNSALSRAAVEGLSKTCNDLKALSLNGCKGLMGDSLLNVIQKCESLERLDLSAISVRL